MITRILLLLLLALSGCTQLLNVSRTLHEGLPLTTTEVISGLREALRVGTDSAAHNLSRLDGYHGNELVKILLPPEANVITRNLQLLPGGEQLVNEVVLRINRAAEDAAKEVTPVFATAITNMTISDGFAILRGNPDAATIYLRNQTYEELVTIFKPRIRASLDKALVGNISTIDSWNTLISRWNRLATSMAGQAAGLTRVEVDLESYLTRRALDGLFLKLAEAEKKIRSNPAERVTALLQRVFAQAGN